MSLGSSLARSLRFRGARPGVGKWLIEAINRRDYPVLQGGLLLLGGVVMLVNLLVDLTYGIINPRIRRST